MKDDQDEIVHPHKPESLRFAENDGDDNDLRLSFKSKRAKSTDIMPRVKNFEDEHVYGQDKPVLANVGYQRHKEHR